MKLPKVWYLHRESGTREVVIVNHAVTMSVSIAITLLGAFGLYVAWRMLKPEARLLTRRVEWVRKTRPRSYLDV